MPVLQKLLYPLSVAYGQITEWRNRMFDKGILTSQSYPLPIIAVGNLSAGGTGKSPMTEYLVRLLRKRYKVAVLSRGYGRRTGGFRLAGADESARTIGDEPYQFHLKFPDVTIAVDGDRRRGIKNLREMVQPDVIVMDDAFQHRYVKAGLYILLTAYGDLFVDDKMLPEGNLREHPDGMQRASIIVVTKCPANISIEEMERIRIRIDPRPHQKLFFSFIEYAPNLTSAANKIPVGQMRGMAKTLVAGIAKPAPFFDHLRNEKDVVREFGDHHDFSQSDIQALLSGPMPIVTTEKDYVRLKGYVPEKDLYYLPIRQSFVSGGERFDQAILEFCASQ